MKIHFVTGKGGVGRSAVAAGLAFNEAQAGKRTLLAELGEQSFYKDYFSLAQVAYQPVPVRSDLPNLQVALLSGTECLKEYAMHLLKIPSLYRLFFENPVSRALISVAPGLAELSILGKITSGCRNVGPKMPYDSIIVDSFATGHFGALLRAPQGMAQAIRLGPMADQSRGINETIRNPQISSYSIVALPEELPVVEGLELEKSILEITGIKASFLLNRFLELGSELSENPRNPVLQDFQKHLRKINERQNEMWGRVPGAIRLPALQSNRAWDVVEGLASSLKEIPDA